MILAVTLIGAFVALRLDMFEWDESRFVLAGEALSDPVRVPSGLYVIRNSSGYDGQAFYRLALDPLTQKKVDRGITLDTPSYRQQRVAYPAIAWLASGGGDATRVPWALILINIVAVGARTTAPEIIDEIVRAFLQTDFVGGRHAERVEKIAQLEERKD